LGAEPGIYFWSGRPSLYRFTFNRPLFLGPRAEELTQAQLKQIACSPPDVVVISTVTGGEGSIPAFLTRHYDRVETLPEFDRYDIWQSNGTTPVCPD
jgi:hypothetical protein